MIWKANRKYNYRNDRWTRLPLLLGCVTAYIKKMCFSPFANTCVCLCDQVIMIECADLKNVINYQEVEALKHTIKVLRGSDELRKIVSGQAAAYQSSSISKQYHN